VIVGYSRSEDEKEKILEYGCSKFIDSLDDLNSGDTLVVVSLFCVANKTKKLNEFLKSIFSKNIGIVCIDGSISVVGDGIKAVHSFIDAIEDFRKNALKKLTNDGLKRRRERGLSTGRPSVLNKQQVEKIIADCNSMEFSIREIAEKHGISRAVIYRVQSGKYNPSPIVREADDLVAIGGLKVQSIIKEIKSDEISKYSFFKNRS